MRQLMVFSALYMMVWSIQVLKVDSRRVNISELCWQSVSTYDMNSRSSSFSLLQMILDIMMQAIFLIQISLCEYMLDVHLNTLHISISCNYLSLRRNLNIYVLSERVMCFRIYSPLQTALVLLDLMRVPERQASPILQQSKTIELQQDIRRRMMLQNIYTYSLYIYLNVTHCRLFIIPLQFLYKYLKSQSYFRYRIIDINYALCNTISLLLCLSPSYTILNMLPISLYSYIFRYTHANSRGSPYIALTHLKISSFSWEGPPSLTIKCKPLSTFIQKLGFNVIAQYLLQAMNFQANANISELGLHFQFLICQMRYDQKFRSPSRLTLSVSNAWVNQTSQSHLWNSNSDREYSADGRDRDYAICWMGGQPKWKNFLFYALIFSRFLFLMLFLKFSATMSNELRFMIIQIIIIKCCLFVFIQIMPQLQCKQHRNPAQLLCIHPQCSKRIMCLLCDHEHQLFTSILQPKYLNYSKFKEVVDREIDKSFQHQTQSIDDTKRQMIQQYYDNIRKQVCDMIEKKKSQNMKMLSDNSNSQMGMMKHARIKGDYYNLDDKLFQLSLKIYNGQNILQLVSSQQSLQMEKAYQFMSVFNSKIDQLFSHFNFKFRIKPPEINKVSNISKPINRGVMKEENYVEEAPGRLSAKFKTKNNTQFQSIISDCHSDVKEIIAVGYDKVLRVFDKGLREINNKEYGNILTKLCPIGDEVYGIGMSKELLIQKITQESQYTPETLVRLKGHNSRINDIHAFNTRIIGSSSDEGLKIWDLYKEKCEYTLKDKSNPSCFRFLPQAKNMCVGYNSHQLKIYSMDTMKIIRLYQFNGVPLHLSQENATQNIVYVSGFTSHFGLIDIRLSKLAFIHNLKSQAISTFKQSIFKENSVILGQRGGKCRIFDMKKGKTRLQWDAHEGKTNLSKPNGIVKVFEENEKQILTAGCNDRQLKIWGVDNN